jgi:hypothetical protein
MYVALHSKKNIAKHCPPFADELDWFPSPAADLMKKMIKQNKKKKKVDAVHFIIRKSGIFMESSGGPVAGAMKPFYLPAISPKDFSPVYGSASLAKCFDQIQPTASSGSSWFFASQSSPFSAITSNICAWCCISIRQSNLM